ncbi:uncharacterized protein LOC115045428 [Echeneis naucrates]|uniref:uncharacterized protein LOC115045428 n=1 Tax=Echeneis naucrates TaxID=173247 RepID=UPI00111431F5|nr:uncharacterized protein LOC115045428 [Echeneis naucrates]
MDSPDPLPLFDPFTAIKEKTPMNQVLSFKVSSMHRVIQVIHRLAQKSCRRACQLFCCPIDTLPWDQYCPAKSPQVTEDKTTQVVRLSPPSTILILNINNSTLIDCAIGNEAYSSSVTESQLLMQNSVFHLHDKLRSSCNHGQQGTAQAPSSPLPLPHCRLSSPEENPSINIIDSHLSCVIIGDNNYMHTEQIHPTEIEKEPQF